VITQSAAHVHLSVRKAHTLHHDGEESVIIPAVSSIGTLYFRGFLPHADVSRLDFLSRIRALIFLTTDGALDQPPHPGRRNTMKKLIISLAALAAVSTAALAERNYDISSPPAGEAVFKSNMTAATYPLTIVAGGSTVDESFGTGTNSGGNTGGGSR
jgi:hypothetical protein